jgi:hypothetical protein
MQQAASEDSRPLSDAELRHDWAQMSAGSPHVIKSAGEESGSGGPLVALFAAAATPQDMVGGVDLSLIFDRKSSANSARLNCSQDSEPPSA